MSDQSALADGGPPGRLQLVSGTGEFNREGLEEFVRAVRLTECGLSYAVVAIVGPQSSGKSTLLNHLFGTTFDEMDALKGRRQTTQGIWAAHAVGLRPFTLVLDIEGTDSRERGEDDTTFEKQSSLFALAVADVVIVNMWCHDIGREQAANKPLLKTVFQVMMRLFSPRKTTLMFVIRDKTRTPMETLEPILRDDIQKIWQNVPKPQKHQDTPLSEFFNVAVTSLPNFEDREEEFKRQVALLRDQFQDSVVEGRLAGDRRGVVPASGFPLSVAEMWSVIRENKDLDLPAHKVMVATVRCEQIANEKIKQLEGGEDWLNLKTAVTAGRAVDGFGSLLNDMAGEALASYDAEAAFFDEGVRDGKRQFLMAKMAEILRPTHTSVVTSAAARTLSSFQQSLDEATGGKEGSAAAFADSAAACLQSASIAFDDEMIDADVPLFDWPMEEIRAKLLADMDAHVAAVQSEKLKQIAQDAETSLIDGISEPIAALLDAVTSDTWADVRAVFFDQLDSATWQLKQALEGFRLPEEASGKLVAALESAGRRSVCEKLKRESQHALSLIKDRFFAVFSHDDHGMPRRWSEKDDVRAITREARKAALRLLAVLAAVRLDTEEDTVEPVLLSLLGEASPAPGVEGREGGEASSASGESEGEPVGGSDKSPIRGGSSTAGLLAASKWEKIFPDATLLTPGACRSLWTKLKAETQYIVAQAVQAQEASARNSSWLPPPWAIVAMIVLGLNEFMALLRNPFLLVLLGFLYFFGKAIVAQVDVDGIFDHGIIPGLITFGTRVLPAAIGVAQRLVEEAQKHLTQPANQATTPGTTNWREAEMDDFSSSSSVSGVTGEGSGGGRRSGADGSLRQRSGNAAGSGRVEKW